MSLLQSDVCIYVPIALSFSETQEEVRAYKTYGTVSPYSQWEQRSIWAFSLNCICSIERDNSK